MSDEMHYLLLFQLDYCASVRNLDSIKDCLNYTFIQVQLTIHIFVLISFNFLYELNYYTVWFCENMCYWFQSLNSPVFKLHCCCTAHDVMIHLKIMGCRFTFLLRIFCYHKFNFVISRNQFCDIKNRFCDIKNRICDITKYWINSKTAPHTKCCKHLIINA